MARSDTHEKAWKRAVPLLAATLSLIVSILLFAQLDHKYGQPLTALVSTYRSSTQIIVQMFSHGLAATQVYSVLTGQKFATRLKLSRATARLEKIAFWMAVSTGQIDTSLSSRRHTLFSVLAFALAMIPGALWTGALTPLLVDDQLMASVVHINVPAYTQSSTAYWDAEFSDSENQLWNHVGYCQSSGTVTTCPAPSLQGLLLGSGASASTVDGATRKHAKLDSADWSYNNRSYGAGASIGNTEDTESWGAAESLLYTEYGYVAHVDCSYNTSSAYNLSLLGSELGPTALSLYEAHGFLPNSFNNGTGYGTGENYDVISSWSDYESILAWSARSIGDSNYIVIATGNKGNYTEFNQTQCEVKFEPSAFNVSANLTSKSITVFPKTVPANSSHLLLDKKITVNTINSVNLLSRMSGSLYTSVLGDVLARNLKNKVTAAGSPNATEPIILASVEDFFMAILDDILGAYGAAQLVLANDSTSTELHLYGTKIKIGSSKYIFAVMAMSILFVVFHVSEMIRTKFWVDLLLFDVFDIKSVIVASSAGGKGIANQLINSGIEDGRNGQVTNHTIGHDEPNHNWLGGSDEKALGRLDVRFWGPDMSEVNRMPMFVTANEIAGNPLESRSAHTSTNRLIRHSVMEDTASAHSDGGSYLLRDWASRQRESGSVIDS